MMGVLKYAVIASSFIMFTGCGTVRVFIKDKESLKKNISVAILTLDDAPGLKGSGSAVTNSLTNEAIKVTSWQLVERTKAENITKELALSMSGLTDNTEKLKEVGKMLNADVLVVGAVTEYLYEKAALVVPRVQIGISIRMVDVETGRILATASYNKKTGQYAWAGCCFWAPIIFRY